MGLSKSKPELKHQELTFVDSLGSSRRMRTRAGKTLLETAVENSVEIPTSCGGMGTCGTCRVFLEIESGVAPEMGEIERDIASERAFAANERLSCQVEIPNESFGWIFRSADES